MPASLDLGALADSTFDSCVDIRRAIHRRPELAFAEHETTALVRRRLDGLGLELLPCPTTTGAVARLRGGWGGRTVMLRADLDALPVDEEVDVDWRSEVAGVMHACGHDGHTAMLLSVASVLAARAESLPGAYVLLFQPAEELAGGARRMIEGGVLEGLGIERMASLHLSTPLQTGLVALRPGIAMSQAQPFSARLRGSGGHGALAGASGNVVLAVAELAQTLESVVEGMEYEDVPLVCSAGVIHAGRASNVVPRTARLDGTLRTFTSPQHDEAVARLRTHCDRIAEANGVEIRLDLPDVAARSVVNDRSACADVSGAVTAELGERAVIEVPPATPSDDVGEFLRLVPGCHFFVGANAGPREAPMHHAPDFSFDEQAMRIGIRALAAAAVGLASR